MLQRFAPIVASDPPDGIVIDSTGADHLHGGEAAMLTALIEKLAGVGLRAGAASPTLGARRMRWRGSRRGQPSSPNQGTAADECRASADRGAAACARLGRIPFACLASTAWANCRRSRARRLRLRFGPELGRRLDQAAGRIAEPIEPIRPEDLIEVRRAFAEPIGAAETLARYIGKLATQLCDALEQKGLGARRLDLICHRVDSRAQAVRVGTGLPLRDAKRMTRLLCDKIDTIDPGFGIEVMTLTATVAEPLAPKQAVSSLVEETEPDVSGLIDLLANRVGETEHLPYRAAWQAMFPSARSATFRRWRRRPTRNGRDTGQGRRGCSRHPEPIDTVALLPDHPPVSFTWRGIRRRMKRADGPERSMANGGSAIPS